MVRYSSSSGIANPWAYSRVVPYCSSSGIASPWADSRVVPYCSSSGIANPWADSRVVPSAEVSCCPWVTVHLVPWQELLFLELASVTPYLIHLIHTVDNFLNINSYVIQSIWKHKQSIFISVRTLTKFALFGTYFIAKYYHYGDIIKRIMINPRMAELQFHSQDLGGVWKVVSHRTTDHFSRTPEFLKSNSITYHPCDQSLFV